MCVDPVVPLHKQESVMEISDAICTDFYHTANLSTSMNNAVGTLTLMEYTEIEFTVTFGEAQDHWTNILRIGNQDDLRFPGLYMSPWSEHISVHKTTDDNLWYVAILSHTHSLTVSLTISFTVEQVSR